MLNIVLLQVVLADGEVMRTASRARKSAAGCVFLHQSRCFLT